MAQPDHPIYTSALAAGLIAGSDLVMAEWTAEGCPAGAEPEWIAPLHRHLSDDEAWYVLEGTLGFRISDAVFEAHAGGAVVAPRGTAHTYWNPNAEPARYLLVMTRRIQALIDAIHAAPDRSPDAMKRLFAIYASEYLD